MWRWAVLILVLAVVLGGCASPPPQVRVTGPSSQVNPVDPVTLAVTGGRLDSVTMTNTATGGQVRGALSPDRLTWRSTDRLGYGTTYRIDAVAVDGGGAKSTSTLTVSTLRPAGQFDIGLVPAPDIVAGPGIGVGQPLVVQFDHPVTDRAAVMAHLHLTSTPAQPGAWFWIDSKHVHYRPQQFWQPGTTINLDADLYGVDLGGGIYGASDTHATYQVHDSWIAKADGDSEQMAIYHNGQLVTTMPISMGKDSTPTHEGVHVISDKQQSVEMNSCTFGVCSGPQAYNVIEHWAERISNDGEFVHQNPASVGAQGNSNVSHGCINLNLGNAIWFFGHFGLGDVVEVANSGGPSLPVWDTYGDWSLSWDQWKAGVLPDASSGR